MNLKFYLLSILTNFRCPRRVATSCWCIMVNIAKSALNNPDAKDSDDLVESSILQGGQSRGRGEATPRSAQESFHARPGN